MKNAIIIGLGVLIGTVLYEIFNDFYNTLRIKLNYRRMKKNRGE